MYTGDERFISAARVADCRKHAEYSKAVGASLTASGPRRAPALETFVVDSHGRVFPPSAEWLRRELKGDADKLRRFYTRLSRVVARYLGIILADAAGRRAAVEQRQGVG